MATMAEEAPAASASQQRRGEKSKKIDRPRRQSQDRSSARLVAEEDSEEMQPAPPQHSLPLAGNPRVSTQVEEMEVPGCRMCLLIPSFRFRPRAPSVRGSRPPPRPSRPSTPQGCWERTTDGRTKWSARGGNVDNKIRTLEAKYLFSRLADVGANGDGPQGAAAAPPSKRAKFLFRKCFDATFNPRTGVTGSDRILAPDSDEEEDGEGAT